TTVSVILSACGVGTLGTSFSLVFAHSGLRSSTNWFPGSDLEIMYGPVDGGGFGVWSLAGVFGGTRAVNGIASSSSSWPFGFVSSIVILPVLSSVLIPEIELALPLWKSAAPTIPLKNGAPPESTS